MKVVELGLDKRLFEEMSKPDYSTERFVRELKKEGIHITSQSVRKFIKKSRDAQQRLASQDLAVSKQIKELTLHYTDELKNILIEVQEVKNNAKEEKDLTTYNQLIGRIFQGIELLAKLSGDLNPKGGSNTQLNQTNIDINIVYKDIEKEIEDRTIDLKKDLRRKSIDVESDIISEDEKLKESLNHFKKESDDK